MSILDPSIPPAKLNASPLPLKFTLNDLHILQDVLLAYKLPLAVIAHVDLNAFYAQCEQLRLGKSIDDPVVCAQWQSLIAVSYAARKYGIGRMDTLQSALEKCPGLVVGHAAVFKKGDTHWQYLKEAPDQGIHKVSLDPYRRELRKIFKVMLRECDSAEKASVDECYLDMSRLVLGEARKRFPVLDSVFEKPANSSEKLPQVPGADDPGYDGLSWTGRIYETEDEAKVAELDQHSQGSSKRDNCRIPPNIADWDDLFMLIGSMHLYRIRKCVYDELSFTTSGGLSNTKTIAKLAGGFNKPDFQTVIRPSLIYNFLKNFELADFTLMGGKAGEVIVEKLGVPPEQNSITYIRDNYTLDEIKKMMPSDELLMEKVYELVRGINKQEMKPRTVVKSMMSRKNFLPRRPVKTMADAYDWIKVYIGDLYGRLIELDDENMNLSMLQTGEDKNKRYIYRPRTVSVQITTQLWLKHSRQTLFPVLKSLDRLRHALEATGFKLLAELLDGTKAADMNPDINFKELRLNDKHDLSKIDIPSLANMGLVITNFVKTSDANLIDSYGAGSDNAEISTQEAIKLAFEKAQEYERKSPPKYSEPQTKPKHKQDLSYVRKLFEDYHNEATKQPEPKEIKPAKPVAQFKEDKEYVKKLFSEFELSSPSPVAVQIDTKNLVSLPSRSKSPEAASKPKQTDSLLKELIKKQYCSLCNIPVQDVFEHKDYHVALDLSLKLNGGASPVKPPKTGTRSSLTSPKKSKPRGNKKQKLDKGQTRLPF